MPTRIASASTAEHYEWDGLKEEACDGWYLVRATGLHIIEERMPPGTSETRHVHARARQFFYVLAGQLTMEVEHHEFVASAGEGIEVAPGQAHTAANRGASDLCLLVTSQPPSHGDRIDI